MARILLVDDSTAVLVSVSRSLQEAGHLVTCTNNGADALCLLETNKQHPAPEILILDMRMPGMDGYDVLGALGPTAPPVIVISGDVDLTEADRAKISRVLPKPFDQTQLLKVVSDVVVELSHKLDGKTKGEPC